MELYTAASVRELDRLDVDVAFGGVVEDLRGVDEELLEDLAPDVIITQSQCEILRKRGMVGIRPRKALGGG